MQGGLEQIQAGEWGMQVGCAGLTPVFVGVLRLKAQFTVWDTVCLALAGLLETISNGWLPLSSIMRYGPTNR